MRKQKTLGAREDMRKIPFTKAEMFDELRQLLLREAARLYFIRGPEAVQAFLGFAYEGDEYEENYGADHLSRVELHSFPLTHMLDLAYDYAFQVGNWLAFDETTEASLRGVANGMPEFGVEGIRNPYFDENSPCRHVVDMACARYSLAFLDGAQTVRGLAVLANMNEATVRNSLSLEGIKMEGKPASLNAEAALDWLSKRRGFIPYRDQPQKAETALEKTRRIFEGVDFKHSVLHAFREAGYQSKDMIEAVARDAVVEVDFVGKLVEGNPVADVEKLVRVAKALSLHPPRFAAAAIEKSLEP